MGTCSVAEQNEVTASIDFRKVLDTFRARDYTLFCCLTLKSIQICENVHEKCSIPREQNPPALGNRTSPFRLIKQARAKFARSFPPGQSRARTQSEVSMGPFTICSGEECSFVWSPQNRGDLPPFFCPLCHKQTLYRCSSCDFPILVLQPDQVNCCYSCSMPLKSPGPDRKRIQHDPEFAKIA
jgi:hypothetical protein